MDRLNKRLDAVENNDEEIRNKKKKTSAEARYQELEKHWYSHDSSWYMRGVNGYDGQGCNQFTGCIPECRYYPEVGRIGDEEVISQYDKRKRVKESPLTAADNDKI